MKKLYKALSGKAAFSLVECVIAIAVFALMAAIVLVILSMAVQTNAANNERAAALEAQNEALIVYGESNLQNTADTYATQVQPVIFQISEGSSLGAAESAEFTRVAISGQDGLQLNVFDYMNAATASPANTISVAGSVESDSSSSTSPAPGTFSYTTGSRGLTNVDLKITKTGDTYKMIVEVVDNRPESTAIESYVNKNSVIVFEFPDTITDFATTSATNYDQFRSNKIRLYAASESGYSNGTQYTCTFKMPSYAGDNKDLIAHFGGNAGTNQVDLNDSKLGGVYCKSTT